MSASTLPITVVARAFDPNFEGTLAEQLDEMAAALRIETQEVFALFVVGSTEPTSNVGPWAKDGNTWMYFDETVGRFVAFLIPQERLKYVVQIDDGDNAHDPDPDTFLFWLVIDEDGNPVDVRTFNADFPPDGDWVGLLENSYTKAEIDAFFVAFDATFEPAVSGKRQILWGNVIDKPTNFAPSYAAKLSMTASQSIIGNAAAVVVALDSAEWGDTGNLSFSDKAYKVSVAGKYRVVVNAQLAIASGVPTDIGMTSTFYKNGTDPVFQKFEQKHSNLGAQSINFTFDVDLGVNDLLSWKFDAQQTGVGTWTFGNVNTFMSVARLP